MIKVTYITSSSSISSLSASYIKYRFVVPLSSLFLFRSNLFVMQTVIITASNPQRSSSSMVGLVVERKQTGKSDRALLGSLESQLIC